MSHNDPLLAESLARNLPIAFSGLTREEEEILDAADKFGKAELAPLASRMDDDEWWPEDIMPKVGANGFLGIMVPQEYGGAGLDFTATCLVSQAFARWNPAMSMATTCHDNLCMMNIYRNGNEEQKRRFLPGMCSGKLIGALGMTEPGAGSDAVGSMATTARRDGDHYVLNGTKIYISNGPVADVLLVYAKTDKSMGNKGISAFIVEKGTPGFRTAQKLNKMGFRGCQTGELVFEDCRIPVENLVGEENRGVGVLMSGLDLERVGAAPMCLGIAERALELSLEHAKTRVQFGKPISEFQMIRDKLATMHMLVDSLRIYTYHAMRIGNALEHKAGGRGEIHKLSASVMLYAGETQNAVLNHAVQVHGGIGYIWESEINRLFRTIKVTEIAAGTNEVRKLIISEEMLK